MHHGPATVGCHSEHGDLLQLVVSKDRCWPGIIRSNINSFQNIQLLSPVQASLRFLPSIIIGVILNLATGLFVQHMRIDYLVTIVSVLAAASPLLLALTDPAWSFWYTAFWSILLSPVSVDGTYI